MPVHLIEMEEEARRGWEGNAGLMGVTEAADREKEGGSRSSQNYRTG